MRFKEDHILTQLHVGTWAGYLILHTSMQIKYRLFPRHYACMCAALESKCLWRKKLGCLHLCMPGVLTTKLYICEAYTHVYLIKEQYILQDSSTGPALSILYYSIIAKQRKLSVNIILYVRIIPLTWCQTDFSIK